MNLTAPFELGQRLGQPMAARGWGRILHVGSQQSWRAFGNNCVIPGFVRTRMTEAIFMEQPERAEALAQRTMIGRNGTPDDFRGITVFLCSDEAAFVTGQVIAVDGGFSAT